MYTKEELIEKIKKLYGKIGVAQDKIISSRLNKDSAAEIKALRRMEGLVMGVQQELMVFLCYLKEHPCWQDVKRIVNIADDPRLLSAAEASGWSEETYYMKVLEESLKADE